MSFEVKTVAVACTIEDGCLQPPRNQCLICEQWMCDAHADAMPVTYGSSIVGYLCLLCVTGDIQVRCCVLAWSYRQITLEDAMRVQRIMEGLTA